VFCGTSGKKPSNRETASLVLAGMDDIGLVIRHAQLLRNFSLLSGQVSSVGQILDVFEPDSLGQEETDQRRNDGDNGSGKDLLEHDVLESLNKTLANGVSQGELFDEEAKALVFAVNFLHNNSKRNLRFEHKHRAQ
jgi:hypothetical protein